MTRLAVIMPVYNEAPTLAHAVARILQSPSPAPDNVPFQRTVILVDDGSDDGSERIARELARDPAVVALAHPSNRGKGAAVATGIAEALRRDADVVLIHDADLEYSPQDHPALLAPILDGRADAVIGSRFLGQTHRVLYFWHAVANKAITLCSNVCTNLNLTDIECCLKAFSRDVAQRLNLREQRFGVEPEIIARLARMRLPHTHGPRPLRIYEVPVNYAGRTYQEGKKITWRDGLSALRCILRYNLL